MSGWTFEAMEQVDAGRRLGGDPRGGEPGQDEANQQQETDGGERLPSDADGGAL